HDQADAFLGDRFLPNALGRRRLLLRGALLAAFADFGLLPLELELHLLVQAEGLSPARNAVTCVLGSLLVRPEIENQIRLRHVSTYSRLRACLSSGSASLPTRWPFRRHSGPKARKSARNDTRSRSPSW